MTDNLLGDRYILGPLLGRGGMAEVRRGRDIRLERDVAIKRLRPDLANDAVFQARFRREAQAAAGLNHPNIVSVYDTGEQFDSQAGVDIPYIVMELVVGHTLRDILRDGRKIQPERALELTTSVLNALDYSHRHGIVHRDIKPANVMVTTSGQVKVMDFGIARAVSDTAASMTQTAAVIGTPQYLSPEQIRGEAVDRRADIYATGCLLYELLAGRPPFQGDEPVSLAYQHVREAPVPPSQLDPVVTPDMDAIVLKALEKSPDNRYQTAKEMADDITRLLTGQQVTAVIPMPAPSLPTPSARTIASEPTQLLTHPTGPQPVFGQAAVIGQPVIGGALAEEDDYFDEEPPRLRKGLIALILTLTVVLVGVVIGIFYYINRPPDTPVVTTVEVPYVITMSEETAKETITAAELVPNVVHEDGPNDDTVGKVVRQDPAEKTAVDKQTEVTVYINDGPKKATIPANLIGLDKAEAEQALREAGFTKAKIDPADPKEYPYQAGYQIDHIITCSPAPGQEVPVDTTVQCYYDTGEFTMPNLSGMTEAQVGAKLASYGVDINGVVWDTQDVGDADRVGKVVGQDPASDQTIKRTDPITVWLGKLYEPPAPSPTPEPTEPPSPTPTPTPFV
ncbi:MAG: Stk1 family PASTA domain-containing Ser/Thr kinase [Propionibacteriaceae bacterium]|jgi:serine/threonine-protein kinase|nr:Stk1 family PASTA domain-containing Ser/Thr kinase [Propionibacteriaceae bacterium]